MASRVAPGGALLQALQLQGQRRLAPLSPLQTSGKAVPASRRLSPLDVNTPHGQLLRAAEEGNVARLRELLASRLLPPPRPPPRGGGGDSDDDGDDEDERSRPPVLDIECCFRTSGSTPLALACLEDHVGAVECLLGFGADPNALDRDGSAPLSWSTHPAIVEALVRHGARVDFPGARSGLTPFLQAFRNGDGALWRQLLRLGADPDAPDRRGDRAVDTAVAAGDLESTRFLLEEGGASARLASGAGDPPLEP